jgi:hypothetical protein
MNKLLAKLVLTLIVLLSSPSASLAAGVIPGDINITNVHFGNNLYYIELENNADKDINLSGFEIISGESTFLYPENDIEPFIVPKNYKIIFSNNISKVEPTLSSNTNIVLVETPELKVNKYGGEVEIKDQLGVSIHKHTYESFVDPDTIPAPIFITASSDKSNIVYDYFDSVFLNVDPTEIEKEDEDTQIIGTVTPLDNDIKVDIGKVTPPLSINGYNISIVLVLSFILFFLFKYFTNTKKTYSYKSI